MSLPDPNAFPTFSIQINGAPVPDTYGVLSIHTEMFLNTVSRASLTLLENDSFGISSSRFFEPGSEISIAAGYDSNNSVIYKGTIAAQRLKVDQLTGTGLEVECQGLAAAADSKFANEPVLTITYDINLLGLDLLTPKASKEVWGVITFNGSNLAQPGKYISLNGLGERFSGVRYISGVVHHLSDGNWTSEVHLGS